MTAPSGTDFARLSALIERQRQELDGLQSAAAAQSVTDLARGMLMEQLSCSPAEAQAQLEHLSAESGTSLPELAAQITGQRFTGRASNGHQAGLAAAAVETAADGDAVATALLEEALADTGATAVAVWLAEPDGGLELAGQSGFAARDASRWRRIHPDMDTPALWAAHDGTETWWPAGPPDGTGSAGRTGIPLPGGWPRGARAVLPLPGPAAAIGALEICWPSRPASSVPRCAASSARWPTCARRPWAPGCGPAGWAPASGPHGPSACWTACWAVPCTPKRYGPGTRSPTSWSATSARVSPTRAAGPRRTSPPALLEMYPGAALAGGLFDCAARVLATGRAARISGAVFSTPAGDSTLTPMLEVRISRLYDGVVIAWQRADEVQRLSGLLHQAQRLGRIGGWEEDLRTGEVLWTERTYALFGQSPDDPVPIGRLTAHVPADDRPAVERFRTTLLRDKREAAAVFRIIRTEDGSVRQMRAFAEPITDQAGTLIAVRGAYQDVSADYHTQVAFAATRDRLADSEERAAEEHRLAVRLQEAITPQAAAPAEIPGLDVAARYRPAGPGNLVSGDWYDTAPLPSGDVLLVVGDIAGHGIDAVTGMVALRNCLRGLAITGAGPGALLGWLNSVACELTDGIIGTVVCGIFHPPARTLRWARAGHLPPLLVRAGMASELELPPGVLVGADPASCYPEVTTSLVPGDALLLFTDGLVERRDEAIDESLQSLRRQASRAVRDIGRFADHLLASSRSDTSDDACLVAVQVR